MNNRLSVIIPARNETFLQKTIESVLEAAVEDIEIIAVCDGYWPEPPVQDHKDVVILHYTESIGQRAAINRAMKIATGKYMMKLDAHCSVAKGFDKILKEDCKYEWTMVPRMYNLNSETWEIKRNKRTDYMYISSPDFEKPFRAMYYGNYQGAVTEKPKSDKLIDETMCCMGPGWFMHTDRFWELGGCDEDHGGWGQQGVEVSLKAWLSGGALMVNKKTWFAHYFRGGGGPGFPYSISGRAVERCRAYSQDLWLNNKWPKQTRSIGWLVDKFKPPTWKETPDTKLRRRPSLVVPKHKPDISVVIPSFRDPLLHKTIQSVIDNFETDYEIIPVIDGYELKQPIIEHERVKPLYSKVNRGMRESINTGVAAANGRYIMRSDEHCMFCKGFDKIILETIEDNWIVDARRYFLDPIQWKVMDRSPIDFEKLIIKQMAEGVKKFASVEWVTRSQKMANVMLGETMAFQGSVWVMAKSWWENIIVRLQTEGYGPLYQDTTEMQFKTWRAGGKLMLNKNAWYAHRHRKFGRTHRYTQKKAKYDWHYALLKWYDDYLKVKEKWKI